MTGLILLNKPLGITSRACVNQVNKALNIKKIGHLGTLDPDASGMLPLSIGEATKFSRFIVDQEKCYTVKIKFGIKTSTGDIAGTVLQKSLKQSFSEAEVRQALLNFNGIITQTVPLISAVRVNGKRLYEYARDNKEVDLPKRQVTIHSIELLSINDSNISLQVVCSKGTYIRSLAEDISVKLGTVGCVETLHRDWVKPFVGWPMVDLDSLCLDSVIALEDVFASFEKIVLSAKQKQMLGYGLLLDYESQDVEKVALYDMDHKFFGIGAVKQNKLKSLRLMSFL